MCTFVGAMCETARNPGGEPDGASFWAGATVFRWASQFGVKTRPVLQDAASTADLSDQKDSIKFIYSALACKTENRANSAPPSGHVSSLPMCVRVLFFSSKSSV